MSGETEKDVSGWTTDTVHQALRAEIGHTAQAARMREQSLEERIGREHALGIHCIARLDADIEAAIKNARRELTAHSAATQRQLDDMREMLLERYQTQQVGLQTAMTAADRATTAALASAEKAVVKAEVSADKRFEAVNEFRAQLNDQAATFPSRVEVDARLTSLAEKMESLSTANAIRIADLLSRVDRMQGSEQGIDASRNNGRQILNVVIGALGLLLTIAVILYANK